MIAVYVAGPYRGANAWDVERNIRRAEEWAMRLAELGVLPVCPHTMFRYFNGTLTDEWWLRATVELMGLCDGLLLTPGWRESPGSRAECEEMRRVDGPILEVRDGPGWSEDIKTWLAEDFHL